jgi:hypothetical protein
MATVKVRQPDGTYVIAGMPGPPGPPGPSGAGGWKKWTGTQAEYDAVAAKDPDTLYVIV